MLKLVCTMIAAALVALCMPVVVLTQRDDCGGTGREGDYCIGVLRLAAVMVAAAIEEKEGYLVYGYKEGREEKENGLKTHLPLILNIDRLTT